MWDISGPKKMNPTNFEDPGCDTMSLTFDISAQIMLKILKTEHLQQ